ncbi:binary toxin-like calcium binding domain-containing protein [Bacillus cereus]|uniref:Protective antigen Ca-binding domain-containing protein n=1 Tax=Bacillus cereus TaxID=1396 RepID=A0A2B9E330_BACCE|nr:binary toxin-like calcium binding domain-containing protein [Bacillus cereus]PGM95215.1 hypothetical protein CN958_08315 [Bacillus cereus]
MKKLKPTLSVLGSVSMALTLASPALADVKQPNAGSTVEIFKKDANAKKEDKNFMYGVNEKVGTLITEKIEMTNNDWDKDGIANELEIQGYKIEFNQQTGKKEVKTWDPKKDEGKPKFVSNPMSANTDGDPFTDMYEVENYNNDSEIDFNPMVANIPNLQIGVKRIEVTPIATIMDNNGGSISRGWEKSVATQHSFNVGAGVEGSSTDATASLNASYGYSKTTTETESNTTNLDWSTATTLDTAKAAKVRVHLEYKNAGTLGAANVSPHFNIRLGNKLIDTVKATQERYKASYLSTKKGGRDKIDVAIDSKGEQAGVDLTLSLDELKAFEQGELLSVEVLPTSTMDLSMRDGAGKFINLGDIGRFEGDVNAATEQLETDIGNIPKFNVYTPKDKSLTDKPFLSYNEVFQHINIDTNKVKNIVTKDKSNNKVSLVVDPVGLRNLKTGRDAQGYLHKDAVHGAFEKVQQPTLLSSSYDAVTKKIRAAISPGLFGLPNEISAIYRDIDNNQKEITLGKRKDGYTYESRENVKHIQFDPSKPVKFNLPDAYGNKYTGNQFTSHVNYHKAFENYVVDDSGEFVLEGTPFKLTGFDRRTYLGTHHAKDNWEYLWNESNINEQVQLVIERVGKSDPEKPIQKNEEVYIKTRTSAHAGYAYLKLANGYIHLDQKNTASTFKFNHVAPKTDRNHYLYWDLQSGGNSILYGKDKYTGYGTGGYGWSISK